MLAPKQALTGTLSLSFATNIVTCILVVGISVTTQPKEGRSGKMEAGAYISSHFFKDFYHGLSS
jgi:hypothetical protein